MSRLIDNHDELGSTCQAEKQNMEQVQQPTKQFNGFIKKRGIGLIGDSKFRKLRSSVVGY